MVTTRLILINRQTSPPIILDNCPVFENIAIPLTMQIADVRFPSEVQGTRSNSIIIPLTDEVRKFFENIEDVNISLSKFDPNLKIGAEYFVDDMLNFDGSLQILKINYNEVTDSGSIECNLIGESVSLFTKVKNLLVENLDFSSYSHVLTFANISASWTTPLFSAGIGSGVVYGLGDWGTNNSNLFNVRPQDFKPSLFYREILQKICTAQGYTWTSTFLDSTDFKRKVIPAANFLSVSSTVENNNKFLATAGGSQVITAANGLIKGTSLVHFEEAPTNLYPIEFPTETYDTGNIYNNATYNFTVPNTAKYNLIANLNLSFIVKRNGVNVNANITTGLSGFHIKIYNSSTSLVEATYDLNIQGSQGALATTTYNGGVALNNVTLTAGHLYYIVITPRLIPVTYTAPVAGATWTLETTVGSTSNFSAQLSTLDPFEGQTVTIADMLPINYKQSDFLSDLIKEFHLQVKVDKANSNNLIIEPWPTFYSTTPIDWDKKHDRKFGIEEIPLGELDFNKLTCKYSEDEDYYNKLYQDEYKEPYGSYTKIILNDFIKNERIIQPSYAATPYAVNLPSQVVLPQFLKKDNNSIGTIKPKVRMLHWTGLITLPAGASWVFKYNNGANSVTYTTQPHMGHSDNPYSPTLDLSWGVPKKVYFDFPNAQWTTNNLYNKYYSQYFNQITDKNSKLIRAKFYLDANDIHLFDFQKPIFTTINDQQGFYIVNKIEDYNPLVSESTMVELLKLIDYALFVPDTIVIDEGPWDDNSGSGLKVMGGNYTGGPDNTNVGQESLITGGNKNFIANSSEDIVLMNSDNVQVVGVENFVGANLNEDSEVADDMINLQDKVKIYSDGHGALAPRVLRVTSDFTVDGKYSIYEIDTGTAGLAITATWDAVAYPVEVTFKMIDDSGGGLSIDDMSSPPSSPPQTIDGNTMPWVTGLLTNDSITVYSNGTNLYII